MSKEQLQKEIDDFNMLLDRMIKGLEKHVPKSIIDDINMYSKQQEEHDKMISFDTKVKCVSDFFLNESEKIESLLKRKQSQ
jgi:hypothetical protein